MTGDLVTRINATLANREALARSADVDEDGDWHSAASFGADGYEDGDAAFMASNSPAFVLRWVSGVREILARHRDIAGPGDDRYVCDWCGHVGDGSTPCPDVLAVASMLGV